MQTRQRAADAAGTELTDLDGQLDRNAATRRRLETELQTALDQVAALKKAGKAANKERTKLRNSRKHVRETAAQARQRAETAETKYDRAVLAEVVRKERDRDLSVHAGTGTGTAGTTRTSAWSSPASDAPTRPATTTQPRTPSPDGTAGSEPGRG